ncbi:MAG: methylamine utilization protein [Rhizobiaceae bacterium]|nr:methylamine utilization protein [Rhizobiaceae bacterium]
MLLRAAVWLGLFWAIGLLAGCGPAPFNEKERATIVSLSLSALKPLPPDPTNAYADQPGAAALGATLFFDTRLSRDGNVSCGTCHKIDRHFQDDLPLGVGVSTNNRRTMPLAGVAWSPFLFWDGRRDSLWAQALTPLEDAREHAGNRAAYAHFIAGHFRERYERIFGPLPDLDGVPDNAGPLGTREQQAAWASLGDAQRDGVDQVFVNLGKAIAAFERSLTPQPTRFDRFAGALAKGENPRSADALSDEEVQGLRLFIGKANCITCHNGPRFTDDHFHKTGVPDAAGLPAESGRADGVSKVLADPFNCAGRFGSGRLENCPELLFIKKDGPELLRAFKTPSLRGVADRPPYMHAGQIPDLAAVVDHYARAPKAPAGHSEAEPLTLSEREKAALVAFLRTLSDP